MTELLTRPFGIFGRHRNLALQYSRRVVQERTKGSVLGVLWQVVNPLFMMLLYTFVFGILFKGSFHPERSESSLLFGIGIYIGLSTLGLVNDTLNTAPFSVVSAPNLVKKVVFPLEILPLSLVLFPLLQCVVGLLLCAGALSLIGHPPSLDWLLIPVIVFPLLLLAGGLSWIVGGLSVYFRDLSQIMNFVTQILFWSSGIFYAAHAVQDYPTIWSILKWNPLLLAIEELRNLMLWDGSIRLHRLFYLYAIGVLAWFSGFWIFERLRKGFADVL